MKYHYYIILFIVFFSTSCEDVVDIEVPSESPRLAVDGLIRINAEESTTTAQIRASLTSSFFNGLAPANLTSISIVNPDYEPSSPVDEKELFLSEVVPGVYEGTKNTLFFTEGELQLHIEHDGQNYLARTRYVPSVPIQSVEQGDQTLFSGNETEIVVSFTDDAERNDFYLFDFDFEEYLVTEDEFYQGQTFTFSYFYEEVDENQEVNISLLGIDESFFNYMNQLIVQSGGDQGPFQTPAATVRGNIINITGIEDINSPYGIENPDNFALGYFAVSQEFTKTIIIE